MGGIMDPHLRMAIRAARNAAEVLLQRSNRLDLLKVKSSPSGAIRVDAAEQAEVALCEVLLTTYPEHQVCAEYGGRMGALHAEDVWHVQALVGALHYVHGLPNCGISIVRFHQGRAQDAVIYDPFSEAMFTASRGQGAYLNRQRIRVSETASLSSGLLAAHLVHPCDVAQSDAYWRSVQPLLHASAGMQQRGVAALDMAGLAAGQFDGFIGFGLRTEQLAPGLLLVREAGGLVGDLRGGEGYHNGQPLVCANPRFFKAMLAHLRQPAA